MKNIHFFSSTPHETIELGVQIAKYLKKGDIICLFGHLGTGKTTLVKGIAKGIGIHPKRVHSPTFVLLNRYKGKYPLFHFDFYRLEDIDQISAIGYDEFLYGEGIVVVEWAERFGGLMPEESLSIKFTSPKEQMRLITISAKGRRYQQLFNQLRHVR